MAYQLKEVGLNAPVTDNEVTLVRAHNKMVRAVNILLSMAPQAVLMTELPVQDLHGQVDGTPESSSETSKEQ